MSLGDSKASCTLSTTESYTLECYVVSSLTTTNTYYKDRFSKGCKSCGNIREYIQNCICLICYIKHNGDKKVKKEIELKLNLSIFLFRYSFSAYPIVTPLSVTRILADTSPLFLAAIYSGI